MKTKISLLILLATFSLFSFTITKESKNDKAVQINKNLQNDQNAPIGGMIMEDKIVK